MKSGKRTEILQGNGLLERFCKQNGKGNARRLAMGHPRRPIPDTYPSRLWFWAAFVIGSQTNEL